MTKRLILYIGIISLVSCVGGKKKDLNANEPLPISVTNSIDNLKTTKDVIQFAKSVDPDFTKINPEELQIKETQLIFDEIQNCDMYKKWNIQNWQKIDLNNDGRSDLLFTACVNSIYYQYAIINKESEDYEVFKLTSDLDYYCKIVKPVIVNNKNQLLVYSYKTDIETVKKGLNIQFTDTLTYKFDSFIEHSNRKVSYEIQSVKYIWDHNFEISIDYNQNAYYKCLNSLNVSNLDGNFYKGISEKKIDPSYFNDIEKLLEYMHVKDLANEYAVEPYDSSTVWVEIKFKDGSVKKIKDYGSQGSYGLNAFYNKMTKLAQQIKWE
ncbi:MAG: hypothetical protein EOO44_12055 [Flavobacterium sp.]|nr:MAG: hypothetical protein EOO44_12055 [Flavobacterium sp.]